MQPGRYAERPCDAEIVAVGLAGLGHIALEIAVSESIALLYSAAACIGFIGYLIWRAARTADILRIWGIRGDNLGSALRAQLAFAGVGAITLVGLGSLSGPITLPSTFWLTLALYPLWAFAQQFALQNLIARNLMMRWSSPLAAAIGASTLFSFSHYPRYDLMALTLIAGVFFTLIYRRVPNLWAVSIAHGILGSLAVYVILREDPGAVLLSYLPKPAPGG